MRAANGELRLWAKPGTLVAGIALLFVAWRATVPQVDNGGLHAVVPIQAAGLSINPIVPPSPAPVPVNPAFSFAFGGGLPFTTGFFESPNADECTTPGIWIDSFRDGVVTLKGCGWGAGGLLRAWLTSDPIALGDIETDRWGEFETDVQLPPAPPGQHSIHVAGADPSGSEVTRSVPLEIAGDSSDEAAGSPDASSSDAERDQPATEAGGGGTESQQGQPATFTDEVIADLDL